MAGLFYSPRVRLSTAGTPAEETSGATCGPGRATDADISRHRQLPSRGLVYLFIPSVRQYGEESDMRSTNRRGFTLI